MATLARCPSSASCSLQVRAHPVRSALAKRFGANRKTAVGPFFLFLQPETALQRLFCTQNTTADTAVRPSPCVVNAAGNERVEPMSTPGSATPVHSAGTALLLVNARRNSAIWLTADLSSMVQALWPLNSLSVWRSQSGSGKRVTLRAQEWVVPSTPIAKSRRRSSALQAAEPR